MQQLRELVSQLKADNERLRQEHAASLGGPSGAALASSGLAGHAPAAGVAAPVTEWLVVIPKDLKCPTFNGKSDMGIVEWVEEAQACARARHLPVAEQALFILDHLEGEVKEEIKFRPREEQRDPARILAILKELYGCNQSYVILQQTFFSRHQQEAETLQEFSLALMALMARAEQQAPGGIPNANILLRDQFTEHVLDSTLRREHKQLVHRQPTITLLELRGEAIRWEREGLPGGTRGRSSSLPAAYGLQYGVQGRLQQVVQAAPQEPGFGALMDLLKRQQEQLNQLARTVASLQALRPPTPVTHSGSLICRRSQQPGHYAHKCEGEQISPRRHANSVTGHNLQVTSPHSSQPSGKLSC